jgi:hypothetical protein
MNSVRPARYLDTLTNLGEYRWEEAPLPNADMEHRWRLHQRGMGPTGSTGRIMYRNHDVSRGWRIVFKSQSYIKFGDDITDTAQAMRLAEVIFRMQGNIPNV